MGNQNEKKSRRWFLTMGLDLNENSGTSKKVKLLTADGKLVEVDQRDLDAAKKTKVSNADIYNWMDNPSKK